MNKSSSSMDVARWPSILIAIASFNRSEYPCTFISREIDMRSILLCLIMSIATVAICAEKEAKPRPSVSDVLAQQRQIAEEIASGDTKYTRLDNYRRHRVQSAQRKVFKALEGRRDWEELDADDKIAVFNALGEIQAILNKRADDEFIVCERVRIVGSHRFQLACMEKDQRMRLADKTQQELRLPSGGAPDPDR
jgi:hypothetical protein